MAPLILLLFRRLLSVSGVSSVPTSSSNQRYCSTSSSVVRKGMVGCLAAVAPPTLQYSSGLLQGLLVEHVPGTVAGQRVLRVVQVGGETQHDVEGGRIVAMTAGVPVQWLLVELAAIGLGTCRKAKMCGIIRHQAVVSQQSGDEMDTVMVMEKSEVPGIAVQCNLLLPNGHFPKTYDFDIADIGQRRRLVRRFFGILIVQIACTLPCLEVLLKYPMPYMEAVMPISLVLTMFLYTCFYVWRDWRRFAPYNYLVLLLSTFISSLNRSMYLLNLVQTHWVYAYPVILILELLALMLYSSQERFRFTQIRGISIICLVFGLFLLLGYRLNRMVELFSAMACTVEAWYVIYDTHFMLCGRHGYNMGPQECIYAACNIHCDLPKGCWRLMRMLFFSKIVEAIRMFRECFRTEVC